MQVVSKADGKTGHFVGYVKILQPQIQLAKILQGLPTIPKPVFSLRNPCEI